MAALNSEDLESISNPIDLVEEIVAANQWTFSRCDNDEMIVEVQGRWCSYRLHFLWREDLGALYFSAAFDGPIKTDGKKNVYELLARANEKLWMGHFELSHDEQVPLFRQTCLMRGQWAASVEQIEDLVEIALVECDRFYPAFQYVADGGRNATQALQLSMVDTVGEA